MNRGSQVRNLEDGWRWIASMRPRFMNRGSSELAPVQRYPL